MRLTLGAAVAAALAGWCGPAIAQTSGTAPGAAAVLDDVVVTARKRAENVQDVPLSLIAVGEAQIERQNLNDLADLAKHVAGFTWSEGLSPVDARPAIRGQSNIRVASQPTVGIFVDGNNVPWRTGLNLQTVDISRIEVVKGPQSAMFGRGVLSGAVNYVTKKPEREFGGYAEATVGQGGRHEVRGRVDLPATDALAFAVTGRWMEFDGLFSNGLTGRDGVGAEDAKSGSVAMLYAPSDAFEAYVRASYSQEWQAQPAYHTVAANAQTGALPSQVWFVGEVPSDPRLIAHNCDACEGVDRETTWVTANLDWQVFGGTFTSLTAYNRTQMISDLDTDFTGLRDTDVPLNPVFRNGFRAWFDRDIRSIGQEFRYASAQERRFRWLAGVFYYDEKVDELGKSILGTTPTPAQVPGVPQENDVETKAVFGSVAFDVTDTLTFGAELRWNEDEGRTDFIFANLPRTLENTWEAWLPRFTVDWKVTPDVMLYANAAKGTKPGGFNTALGAGVVTLPADLLPFDEEEAWSYEIGMKSQWFDRRLTLNVAAFRIDWTNVQVDSQYVPPPPAVGTVGYTSNAGRAEVEGAELELSWQATDRLELSAAYAYTPARIFDYQVATAAAAGISTLGEQPLPFSADDTATASAVYTVPFGTDASWFVQADAQYRSSLYAVNSRLAETGDRTLVDLRAGVRSEHWDVTASVTNLFADDTPNSIAPFLNPQTLRRVFIVGVPDPRLWGVRVRYSF